MKSQQAIGEFCELDIYLYVAHERLAARDVNALMERAFGELEWTSLAATIFLIVADDCDLTGCYDPRTTTIHVSDAAAKFSARCAEWESAPRDVLVCFGSALPAPDAIGRLQTTLQDDDMAAAVSPRVAIGSFGHLVPVFGSGASNDRLIDRSRSWALPTIYYLPEELLPCMCISRRVIGNIDLPTGFDTFPELILGLLRAGRRRGRLLLVDNRSVLSLPGFSFDKNEMLRDQSQLGELFDDYARVKYRLEHHPVIAQERRMSVSFSDESNIPSLLLDCTNVAPFHNGTSECALGIMGGVNAGGAEGWTVTAMANDESRRYFSLDDRFPAIRFVSMSNNEHFDVAIRLSQVWSLSTMVDLTNRARSVAITILDTIGPEIIYAHQLVSDDAAFQFVGEHADGLIYISEFSRHQFRRRYFVHPDTIESVIYLSLDPNDYITQSSALVEESWILLLGNSYDHKDLLRTVDALANAFPFEQFKVMGIEYSKTSNVEAVLSGSLSEHEIDSLFRGAKCVIFPSFYEGFGFPVVKSLAHDKPVIVRRSKLWYEIARNMPDVGRLIEFTNTLDLVRIVALLLRGQVPPSLKLGDSVSDQVGPHNWTKAAKQILGFANQLRSSEKPERCLRRDRALRYISELGGH